MLLQFKKNDKQSLANYWLISLYPICGKIFERLLYNEMFNFFIINHLVSTNQTGFKPGGSCINQLLSIIHGIYASLHEGYEILGVFLDISKAFDKVWHEGLMFKLEQNGISGNLLRLIKDFLSNRHQKYTNHFEFYLRPFLIFIRKEKVCSFKWTMLLLDGCPSMSSSRFYTWILSCFNLY